MVKYTIQWLLQFKDRCTEAPKDLIVPDYGHTIYEEDRLSWRNKKKTHRPPSSRRKMSIKKPPPTFSKKDLHAKVLSLLNKLGKANLESTFVNMRELLKNETDQSTAARYLFNKICGDEPTLMGLYLTLADKLGIFTPFKDAFFVLVNDPPWNEATECNAVGKERYRGFCMLTAELIKRGVVDGSVLTENLDSADHIFNGAINEPELITVYMYLCERLFKCKPFKERFIRLCQDRPWRSQAVAGGNVEVFSAQYYKDEILRQRFKGYSVLVATLFKRGFIPGKEFLTMLEGLKNDCFTEPETLECLCSILTDCGVVLDRHFRAGADEFVKTLIPLTRDTRLPSRLRFKVMDILDLSGRHWIPKGGK